jgi:two-component system sensor histidine kinase RpfC
LGTVLLTSPVWRALPEISAALFLANIVVPLYASLLLVQVARARRQAEQANRAKDRLLAKVSHELRTPLTTIQSGIALLAADHVIRERSDVLRPISDAVRSLIALVADLLEAGRLGAETYELRPEKFDLYELLLSAARSMRTACGERRLGFSLRLHHDVPRILFNDPTRIRQILENLLGNACKFSDRGTIELVVTPRAQKLRFEVLDRGIGINEAEASAVFDAFRQGEAAQRRGPGAGLGLAIVRQLVTAMDGTAGLDPRIGGGAVAWIELPYVPAPTQQAASRDETALVASDGQMPPVLDWIGTANQSATGQVALFVGADDLSEIVELYIGGDAAARSVATVEVPREREAFLQAVAVARTLFALENSQLHVPELSAAAGRVLLVDDNDVNRSIIGRLLTGAGCDLSEASSGEEALQAIETTEFDLVLLDVRMEGVDGPGVARLVRASTDPRIAATPLVALTADDSEDTRLRCAEAAMNGFFAKPIRVDELDRLLKTYLRPRERASEASRPMLAGAPYPIDWSILGLVLQSGDDASAFLATLVNRFRTDTDRAMMQIDAAAKRDDVAEFRSRLHRLRSAALQLGAMTLGNLLGRCEASLPADWVASAGKIEAQIRMEATHAADALAAYRATM